MKTGCVILAAGSSSRMGKSKLLLPVHDTPLLVYTIRKIMDQSINPILVVLGSDAEKHRDAIQHLRIDITVNDDWSTGMGSSIRKGLKEITRLHPDLKAIVVAVSDQPLIPSAFYQKLITTASSSAKKIIASGYSGTLGVPVLIKNEALGLFEKIENQHGAKRVLETHRSLVDILDCPEGALDIDTPADYQKLLLELKS